MIAVGQAVRRCNRGAQSIDVRYAPIVLNKSVFGGGWRRGRMRTSGLGRVYPVIAGWVIGIILAILRRFWAVAARRKDRKSVVMGKGVSVRVDLGVRR